MPLPLVVLSSLLCICIIVLSHLRPVRHSPAIFIPTHQTTRGSTISSVHHQSSGHPGSPEIRKTRNLLYFGDYYVRTFVVLPSYFKNV